MSNTETRSYVPVKKVQADYPLIDSDPALAHVSVITTYV
ncbi:hypothetical protein M7I_2874 [Glarea lozoyensis 74030]|uniref:Uncharacterized protein n=1 Tax=Glarea lozoyensis (strain ATCC 74030 / MF5533) TaxID=1104152 RepID=H0EJZ0_GLAL7|nr:hypothetical protein M7I_2874 [Glarea lozoyensis 74030]